MCVIELAAPVAGLHGTVQGAIACIVWVSGTARRFTHGVRSVLDLGPSPLDRIVIYLTAVNVDTGVEICRDRFDTSDWTGARRVANLSPLREFMGPIDEAAEARARLFPG